MEVHLASLGISLHGKGHVVGEVGLFGVGGCNPSPFDTPNELNEEEILAALEKGYEEVKETSFKIMIPHMPPRNTGVDVVHSGLHVGSTSVRRFIEEKRPDLCISGHIHEAVGEDRIGGTRILNPGPFFEGGFVVIDIDGNEVDAELRFLA